MEINKKNFINENDFILFKIKTPKLFSLPEEEPLLKCVMYKKRKILKQNKTGLYHFFDDKILYFSVIFPSKLYCFHLGQKNIKTEGSYLPREGS